ncbi:class I SAM-dependent methyltransferase [Flavobacterium sp.]|uniref:class I SAM-dependent methyltransferase n=1 Tax=Flavobacterium sp. TaxID=239 RepID=UPI0039E6E987
MDKSTAAAAVFDKLADVYQSKYMDVSLYADSLDLFCRQAKADAQVLELACGPGNITQYLLNKRPDLKILGTDLAPNMIALARANNASAQFEIMDCRQINRIQKQYDALMCGFCLPYLSKEEALQLIVDAATIVRPGGIFYLSTMEDDYAKSGIEFSSSGDSMFMHYHESGYLKQALGDNGFEIIDCQRISYEHHNKPTTDLILVASKSAPKNI